MLRTTTINMFGNLKENMSMMRREAEDTKEDEMDFRRLKNTASTVKN